MPLMTPMSYHGLGFETTRGTGVVPTYFFPFETPQGMPKVTWLQDKGMRGSPTDVYSNQAGVRHDEWDDKGNVFGDTFGMLLRAILGSTDTVVTAPTSTTLSASAIVGANSVSTVATIAAGASITIGAGTTAETHITGTPTGAGPFTIPLLTPLINAQASGNAVAGLTSHTIGQVYNVATGSQPPSSTLIDFEAGAAGTSLARQYTGAMLSELSISFASDGPLSYTAKWLTNAAGTVTAPSQSFSTELFIPSWNCGVILGGTQSSVIAAGSLDIKRNAQVIHTLGSQSPYRIWAGPLSVTGKLTAVFEQGDVTMTNAAVRTAQTLAMAFNDPFSKHLVQLQMSQIQQKDPKILRSKSYLEVESVFDAEANVTDAVGGGYAPLKTFLGNAVTTAYA